MWPDRLLPRSRETENPPHRRWPVRSHDHDAGPNDFTLRIIGRVKQPIELDWPTLRDMQTLDVTADLDVATGPGPRCFEGVDLRRLIESASPDPNADLLKIHSDGGYRVHLPILPLYGGKAILAYSMEGRCLSRREGGPLRLVLPQLEPWHCAKWVRALEIEASDTC